jgi:hypothetical protein
VLLLCGFLRLIRLDSSVLAFLAIFLPLWVRSGHLSESFGKAIPLLFVYMCAFIANDLDDIEKDRVNHPDRLLAAGYIRPALAAVLYFICLAFALFLTRHYVSSGIAFLYYALISLHISYGYLVESLAGLKAPYVAAMNTIPILIVASHYPKETKLYVAATAVFFLVIGREICMDIRDRPGDSVSFMHRFPPTRLATVGFGAQVVGLLLLGSQIRRIGDFLALLTMVSVLGLSATYWFKFSRLWLAIIVMKLQWFVGLYFLI